MMMMMMMMMMILMMIQMMTIFSLFQPPTSSFSAMIQKHWNWDQDLHGIGTQQNHRSKCSSGQQSFRQERLKTKLRSQQSLGFLAGWKEMVNHRIFQNLREWIQNPCQISWLILTFADGFSISRSLQCQEFMVDGRMDCAFLDPAISTTLLRGTKHTKGPCCATAERRKLQPSTTWFFNGIFLSWQGQDQQLPLNSNSVAWSPTLYKPI